MSDERPGDEAAHDEPVPSSAPAGEGAQDPATPTSAPTGDDPLIPRRLPSAASFFGEPRAPRHSAHVASPSSAPSGLPTEQPQAEGETAAAVTPVGETPVDEPSGAGADVEPEPVIAPEPVAPEPDFAPDSVAPEPVVAPYPPVAESIEPEPEPEPEQEAVAPEQEPWAPEPDPAPVAEAPAVPFYVPPPLPEPTPPVAPHPQALDLSALQGGGDLLPPPTESAQPAGPAPEPWHLGQDVPSLDTGAFPAHDEPGETPTAAFGALFGDVPTAGTPVVPPTPAAPPASSAPAVDFGGEPSGSDRPSAEPSFTELISMPPAGESPATFDWNDLPAPRTTEIDLPHATSVPSSSEPSFFVPGAAAQDPAPASEDTSDAEPDAAADRSSFVEPWRAPESPVAAAQEPAVGWDGDPATQALPRVWSLDDDGDSAAAPRQAEPAPLTDPFMALFGDALEPVETRDATPTPDDGDSEAGVDGGWADVPRAPIPPALDEAEYGAAAGAAGDAPVEPAGEHAAAAEPAAEHDAPVEHDAPNEPDAPVEPEAPRDAPVEPAAPRDAPVELHARAVEPTAEPLPSVDEPDAPTVAYEPPAEPAAVVVPVVPVVPAEPVEDAEPTAHAEPAAYPEPVDVPTVAYQPPTEAEAAPEPVVDPEPVDVPTVAYQPPTEAEAAPEPTADPDAYPEPTADQEPVDVPTAGHEPVDVPTVAYQPPAEPADVPTVTFEPPTQLIPDDRSAVDGGEAGETPAPEGTPADPDPAIPSRFSQQAGAYRGPSSRPVMPIDASKAPASWVAAAAQAQNPAAAAPTVAPSAPLAAPARPVEQSGGGGFWEWPQNRRILVFVGIGIGFVLILVALFLIGQTVLGNAATPPAVAPTTSAASSPTTSSRPTPTPTPTPTMSATTPPVASGPASPGTHPWTALQGGECLGSFTNAWQTTYQVVDCTATHPAQMVAKGTIPGATYAGFTQVGAQVGPLCQSSSVIDFSKAAAYTDIQVSASYPATQAQWDSGDHSYYCFVSRASGQAITGSVKAGS